MAFVYEVDAVARLVVVRPERAPTIEDWIDVLDRLIADPRIQPGFGIISDRRHIQGHPTTEYVRDSIDALFARRAFFKSHRVAILTNDTATYGMARMAEMLADNRELEFGVFRDENEARAWAASKP